MLERIAGLLRGAREERHWSTADVAREANVDVAIVEALEATSGGVSTTALRAVADALLLDPMALLRGERVSVPRPTVFLRHADYQDFEPDDHATLDAALAQGRAIGALGKLLGEPPLAVQNETFRARDAAADTGVAPATHGYKLARELRTWLGDATGPIADIAQLAERRLGIAVLVSELATSNVTVACTRSDDAAAVVFAASDAERARNPLLARVYLAHELCHLLFDPLEGGLQIVIERVNDRRVAANEQRAKAFAAELLLPREGLVAVLGEPLAIREPSQALDLVRRARGRFGSPHDITANHLCNHLFVAKELREWLEAAHTPFEAPGLPTTTLPAPGAPSVHVRELVERAHHEGILTDGEAREVLRLERLQPLPWDALEP